MIPNGVESGLSQTRPRLDELRSSIRYFTTPTSLYGGGGAVSTHTERLRYAAGQLDGLPPDFWEAYDAIRKWHPGFPYIPLQIVEWGQINGSRPLSERQKALLGEGFSWKRLVYF